jgi:hypothetical protein
MTLAKAGAPMPKSAAMTLAVALAAAAGAHAQEPPPLSTEVELAEFGVSEVSAIVRGRVSVVGAPEGPRLEVRYLTTEPAPPPPPPLDGGPGTGGPDSVGEPPRDRVGSVAGGGVGGAAPRTAPLSALWVWSTEAILADAAEHAALKDLVAEQRIDRVFLYLPAGRGSAPSAGFVPFDGAVLGPLVAELRALGALVYALDGDPEYVRPENHAGVVRTVERVVAHNQSVPAEQRFYGVRYDVEPYLLPGFQGPARADILAGYVRLIRDVSAAARRGGLVVGVDIPFWLDAADEVSGDGFYAMLDGLNAPVLEHVLGLVDDVALMAYRTFSSGPDGVLTHVEGELVRARSTGTDVFIGVETTRIHDEELHTFRGPGRAGLPLRTDGSWVVIQALDDGRARVWLIDGDRARDALLQAAGGDSRSLTYWFAGVPVQLPGERLSYHSLGLDAMRQTVGEVLRGVADAPSFRGMAYHDYQGLSALLRGR